MSEQDDEEIKVAVNYADLAEIAYSYKNLNKQLSKLKEDFENIKSKTIKQVQNTPAKKITKQNNNHGQIRRYQRDPKPRTLHRKYITKERKKQLLKQRIKQYKNRYGSLWFLNKQISQEYANFRDTLM